MNLTIKELLKKSLKVKTQERKQFYLSQVLDIDKTNPLAITLLARLDSTYEDKALKLFDINVLNYQESEKKRFETDNIFQVFVSVLYFSLKKKDYVYAIEVCIRMKTVLSQYRVQFDNIQAILQYALEDKTLSTDFDPYGLLTAYKQFKTDNMITKETLFTLFKKFPHFVNLPDLVEPISIPLCYAALASYPNQITYQQEFSVMFSLFNIIFADFSAFRQNLIDALGQYDLLEDYSPEELNIILYLLGTPDVPSTKALYRELIKIEEPFPFMKNHLYGSSLSFSDFEKIITNLTNKGVFIYPLLLSEYGAMLAIIKRETALSEETEALREAMEIFSESLEHENYDNSLDYLRKAKEIYPHFYDADYFMLMHSDILDYEHLYTLYLKCKKRVQLFNLKAEEYTDESDTLYAYIVSVYKRISDRLIQLSIFENKDTASKLLQENLDFFRSLSPLNYVFATLYAMREKDRKLKASLNHLDYSFLPNEVFDFFSLVQYILNQKEDKALKLIQNLLKKNPYIPCVLFKFFELENLPIMNVTPLDYMVVDNITHFEVAVNLVNAYFLVFQDIDTTIYQEYCLAYYKDFMAIPMHELALLYLKGMFSIQWKIKEKDLIFFLKGDSKVASQFSKISEFQTSKALNQTHPLRNGEIKHIISKLRQYSILNKDKDFYHLTVLGINVLNRLLPTNEQTLIS